MKKALLVFVCILGLFSCATYRLDPLPSQDITIRNERGKTIPLYSDEKIGMVIIPEFVESELMLKVHVLNKTDSQISIKDTDFIIEESLDRINWKELYVYDSHEYYKKEKAQYIAGAILMVLGAAADSASAGYGTASTSGTVYRSSSYGSYSGSYYGTTTYYDPAAAQIASQRNAQMVENYAASGRSWLQMLEENLFYSVDLNPGQEYFGIIFSKKGSSVYYRVRSKNDNIRLLSIEYLKVQN